MTPQEYADAARTGAVAGICPTTEANLGDGIFDMPLWLQQGGRWGVGCGLLGGGSLGSGLLGRALAGAFFGLFGHLAGFFLGLFGGQAGFFLGFAGAAFHFVQAFKAFSVSAVSSPSVAER